MQKMFIDQADGLRRLMAGSLGWTVAVVGSGPTVGATSVTLNLAAALMHQGRDVLLFDEHGGGARPPVQREGRLVLIDAVLDGDGILSPLAAQADHVLVVLQPHAASITAAYGCIKRLHRAHAIRRLRVLVNHVADMAEAQRILVNLVLTGNRYLSVTLESAGCVRFDPRLPQAQRLNLPVVEAFPTSPAAMDFLQIASDLLQLPWQPPGREVSLLPPAQRTSHEAGPVLAMH